MDATRRARACRADRADQAAPRTPRGTQASRLGTPGRSAAGLTGGRARAILRWFTIDPFIGIG
ncbi:conserved hypothetical protein [Burkholderia mallei GB8 horse 4]|nr:hypothetical protein BMASAVP1_A2563 [Burkholderia mallei SAVP1]EEP87558.1 conserved hypothetical protein [Burkholderia mallei GB8 horse 4]KOS90052.1 cysteine synthase B [Burkholderia mallei]KOT20781.1 cysteine synthase B [Burkholderia mallei]